MPADNDSFFVHVVESPANFDLLDGRTEGRVLLEALNLSEVPATYNLVTNRRTLEVALGERLTQATAYYKRFPVLHLSLHGNEEGIQLTTENDFLAWSSLREILLPINQRLGSTLIVCLSSCFGAAGCKMAMYENQPIPFFALVGHPDSATWSDAAVAFVTFYHRLRRGANVFQAVEAMKVASADQRFQVYLGSKVQDDFATYLQRERSKKALHDLLVAAPPPPSPFMPGPS